MRLKTTTDLLVICIWTVVAAIAAMVGAWSWIRIVLGLPMVVFFPGYCLVALAAPRNDDLKPVARLAISVGVSLIFFPLLDVLLNYVPVGITVSSAVLSLSAATVLLAAAAWLRRTRLPDSERLRLELRVPASLVKQTRAGKALNLLLLMSMVVALVSGGYAFLAPRDGETFTEFYVLGAQDSILGYPRYVRVGEPVEVLVGVVNEEGTKVPYRVVVQMNGTAAGEGWSVVTDDGEKAEKVISFIPARIGDRQRVDFTLYRADETEPYRSTYFWLNVKAKEERFTEFYLSGPVVPDDLYSFNTIKLKTVIVNHEGYRVTYGLDLRDGQDSLATRGPVVSLGPEEKWEGEIPLYLAKAGELSVQYRLYRDDEPQPAETIRLYLEIRSQQAP